MSGSEPEVIFDCRPNLLVSDLVDYPLTSIPGELELPVSSHRWCR